MINVINVKFMAIESEHDNCICNCCHGTDYVLKLQMPSTLYHDGEHLTTVYRDLWICDDCRKKLISALSRNGGMK